MRHSPAVFIALAIFFAALTPLGQFQTVQADITWTGDIDPADPTTWTSDTWGYIGNTADGTLTVDSDSDLLSYYAYIGYDSGVTGQVTVTGAGSTWTNSGYALYVGFEGSGTLTISDGGTVNSSSSFLSLFSGSTGEATVDGTGSAWNCSSLYVGGLFDYSGSGSLTVSDGGIVSVGALLEINPVGGELILDNGTVSAVGVLAHQDNLLGTGVIDTQGWVYNGNKVFSQASDLQEQLIFNTLPDQNVTVNIDLTSGTGILGAGYAGTGSLTIENGMAIESSYGYIGSDGGEGTVTVTGSGSSWTTGNLYVGDRGTGSLNIESGGAVVTTWATTIGSYPSGTGSVTVSGSGSIWHNLRDTSSPAYIGVDGTGVLIIENGGQATFEGPVVVNSYQTNSRIELDNGTLTARALFVSPNDLLGAGTVDTRGWCFDGTIVFDELGDLQQQMVLNSLPGQNVTVNLDFSGGEGRIGAGYEGVGSLTIENGTVIGSDSGYIGYQSGANGTITVDGPGSIWNCDGLFQIGFRGTGTLNIHDGGVVNSTYSSFTSSMIGAVAGSTGVVNVNGENSIWSNTAALRVGSSGNGTLNIENGGTVEVSSAWAYIGTWESSTGEATVDGVGSTWDNSEFLLVGYRGTGTLTIQNGGEVTNTNGYIGDYATGVGTATVDGVGSTWTSSGALLVGNTGQGALLVQNAGSVLSNDAYIGNSAGSIGNATITGSSSNWTNNSGLILGGHGEGSLTIQNDGAVLSARMIIGGNNVGVGNATVDGVGSQLINTDFLFVADHGNGSLMVQNGGTVSNGWTNIGGNSDGVGTVTVDGAGSTISSGTLYVGQAGQGALLVENGGAVTSSGSYIGNSAGSVGNATVTGNGSTWTNASHLFVGNQGSGALAIQDGGLCTVVGNAYIDNTTEGEGTLSFGIGLSGLGLFDIAGRLTIGDNSTLLVSVDSGINLDAGTQFTVVTFDTISGTFANEPGPNFSGDNYFDWAVHYNANDITLEVATSVLASDFDEDNDVDGDDFLAWQTGFGANIDATHLNGDADGDGDVDGDDFLIWQTQFGSTAGNGAAVAVPEPTSLLLAVATFGILGLRSLRRPA